MTSSTTTRLLWLLLVGCGSRSGLTLTASLSEPSSDSAPGTSSESNAPSNNLTGSSADNSSSGSRNQSPRNQSPEDGPSSGSVSDNPEPPEPPSEVSGSTPENQDSALVPCRPEEQGASAVFAALSQALEGQAREAQAFTRFLVAPTLRINHCYGVPASEANYSEFSRDGLREQFAATKLVNSTSLETSIVRVQGVPGLPWLLRIDLRELGWDQPLNVNGQAYSDAWEASTSLAAQSLQFTGIAADLLSQRMQTTTPFLLIGDFMTTVGQGEMYYALTAAPDSLQQLQSQFGILPTETLDTSAWLRAGFSTSGVSRQVRGVARYVGENADNGLIDWQSRDFEPDTTFPSIYEDPLGSGADLKRVTYNLPNGMLAYFLADSEGNRVSKVPASIDINPAENVGVSSVGATCFSCHNNGLVPFTDQVREFVEQREGTVFSSETVRRVQEIYRPTADVNKILKEDSRLFANAVLASGIPIYTADPVSRVFRQNELGDLMRLQAAAELFIAPEALTEQFNILPVELRIPTDTRALNRNQFVRIYRQAMCALLAGGSLQVAECP